MPIEPLPDEVLDFGEGEWPVEGIVDEHRQFHGRTYYKIAWEGWTGEDGSNTTWEDGRILDEDNEHFLETWRESEKYREIGRLADRDPLEVPVTFPQPTDEEEHANELRWQEILRREERDRWEEIPFMPHTLFTTANNADFENGTLRKLENWRAGRVPDPPPERRAWLRPKSRPPKFGLPKDDYTSRRRKKEEERKTAELQGVEEERPIGRRRENDQPRLVRFNGRLRTSQSPLPGFSDDDSDDSLAAPLNLRRRQTAQSSASSTAQFSKPQTVRKRVYANLTKESQTASSNSGSPASATPNINQDNEESIHASDDAPLKQEPVDEIAWSALSNHYATLVISEDSSDYEEESVAPPNLDTLMLVDPSDLEIDEPKTIAELAAEWNEEAARVGAAPLNIVNEIDDEPPIPHGVEFQYIENSYTYADDVPPELRPAGVLDWLGGCDHPGPCTVANKCPCRTDGYQDQNIYNNEGLVIVDFPTQNDGITECNILCKCRGQTFVADGSNSRKGKGREQYLDSCTNRVGQSPRKYPLEIFKTGDGRGWGVRCLTALPKGAVLGLYTGKLVKDTDPVASQQPGSSYSFELNMRRNLEEDEEGPEQVAQEHYVVCGYNHGNWTRFVNHSCEPVARTIAVLYDTLPLDIAGSTSLPKLAYVTKRDLRPMTEITIDYDPVHKEQKGEGTGGAMCRCGARRCRGAIFV